MSQININMDSDQHSIGQVKDPEKRESKIKIIDSYKEDNFNPRQSIHSDIFQNKSLEMSTPKFKNTFVNKNSSGYK